MSEEEYKKLNTYEKIEYDIEMKMYMEHNNKIATINDNLGDMYSYKDLEEAIQLEEHDTLQEYKKALKEKCNVIDKAIEYIKENKYVSADENCEIIAGWRIEELLEILGDKENESN